jgi:hypothetical protein
MMCCLPGSCPSSPMAKKTMPQGTWCTPISSLEASACISPDPTEAWILRVVVDQNVSLQLSPFSSMISLYSVFFCGECVFLVFLVCIVRDSFKRPLS